MEKKPWYRSQTLMSLLGVAVSAIAPKYIEVIPPLVGDVAEIAFLVSAAIGRIKQRNLTLRKPSGD